MHRTPAARRRRVLCGSLTNAQSSSGLSKGSSRPCRQAHNFTQEAIMRPTCRKPLKVYLQMIINSSRVGFLLCARCDCVRINFACMFGIHIRTNTQSMLSLSLSIYIYIYIYIITLPVSRERGDPKREQRLKHAHASRAEQRLKHAHASRALVVTGGHGICRHREPGRGGSCQEHPRREQAPCRPRVGRTGRRTYIKQRQMPCPSPTYTHALMAESSYAWE
jgi:hypothetical protein